MWQGPKHHYPVLNLSCQLTYSVEELAAMPAIIESGFIPYLDNGRRRYMTDECMRPYQVLSALILVCPHCHSIKNLERMRRLASEGKFDIEPVLQHYMKVNGVTRQKALRQWAAHRGQHDFMYIDPVTMRLIHWTQWVQTYDQAGKEVEVYTPLAEWITDIKANGVEAISPYLFSRVASV